jgi:hypothetical protein
LGLSIASDPLRGSSFTPPRVIGTTPLQKYLADERCMDLVYLAVLSRAAAQPIRLVGSIGHAQARSNAASRWPAKVGIVRGEVDKSTKEAVASGLQQGCMRRDVQRLLRGILLPHAAVSGSSVAAGATLRRACPNAPAQSIVDPAGPAPVRRSLLNVQRW